MLMCCNSHTLRCFNSCSLVRVPRCRESNCLLHIRHLVQLSGWQMMGTSHVPVCIWQIHMAASHALNCIKKTWLFLGQHSQVIMAVTSLSYVGTTAALVTMTCAMSLQVVIAYAIGTAAALAGFWACPNQPSAQWLAVATVGFFLYGPQMLIGLCGAEVVSPSAVGASQGFLGWISYLGQYSFQHHLIAHMDRTFCISNTILMNTCGTLACCLTLCGCERPRS